MRRATRPPGPALKRRQRERRHPVRTTGIAGSDRSWRPFRTIRDVVRNRNENRLKRRWSRGRGRQLQWLRRRRGSHPACRAQLAGVRRRVRHRLRVAGRSRRRCCHRRVRVTVAVGMMLPRHRRGVVVCAGCRHTIAVGRRHAQPARCGQRALHGQGEHQHDQQDAVEAGHDEKISTASGGATVMAPWTAGTAKELRRVT